MAQLFLIKKTENPVLSESTKAELLLSELKTADSFVSRGVGLLSRKEIGQHEALWLRPCNNIHTFFMRFKIDCIFLDSKMRVQKIHSNIKPFRFVGPVWKANSAIETAAGLCDMWQIKVGDQLYVVD